MENEISTTDKITHRYQVHLQSPTQCTFVWTMWNWPCCFNLSSVVWIGVLPIRNMFWECIKTHDGDFYIHVHCTYKYSHCGSYEARFSCSKLKFTFSWNWNSRKIIFQFYFHHSPITIRHTNTSSQQPENIYQLPP